MPRGWQQQIDPGVPCFIGGASFGGMIAVEMLEHLDARACFLIGSAKHSGELPRALRLIQTISESNHAFALRSHSACRGPCRKIAHRATGASHQGCSKAGPKFGVELFSLGSASPLNLGKKRSRLHHSHLSNPRRKRFTCCRFEISPRTKSSREAAMLFR